MMRRERLGPAVYSALHAHNMLLELMLLPSELRAARADAAALRRRLPFLDDYEHSARDVSRRLRAAYDDYTARVSPASIAIAFRLATFLGVVCEATRPAQVLDLGSGFSSYVLGACASRAGVARPDVRSVDLSAHWLDKTRRFLAAHAVSGVTLTDLDAFRRSPRMQAGLVLLDIGELAQRVRLLDLALDACRPGGLLVIDDMHVPRYRRAMRRALRARGVAHFSLRAFTRSRLRYAYLAIR
jgi:predicted O-methyltransferase YrrM